jgi:rod shape-determining protein MreD
MISQTVRNILRFISLILLQGLIVKNIDLGRFINPFIYVMFIITLPFNTPRWLLLVSSFFLGLAVDMFYDTIGVNAAASVFMAFCRPYVYNLFSPRNGYDSNDEPSIQHLGISWFLSCSGILIVLHHFVLFYLEIFKFSEFFSTLFRVILSSLFSLFLVVLSQFLLYRNKE